MIDLEVSKLGVENGNDEKVDVPQILGFCYVISDFIVLVRRFFVCLYSSPLFVCLLRTRLAIDL